MFKLYDSNNEMITITSGIYLAKLKQELAMIQLRHILRIRENHLLKFLFVLHLK